MRHLPTLSVWLVVVLAVPVLAAPALGDEPAPKQRAAHYEIRFMENMIDHHQMAVVTSMLCQERAIHEELQALCEDIEATQTAEISEMQAWLDDWYGIEYHPQMTKRMERQVAMLAALQGEEFEVAFLMMMIEHHAVAVEQGAQCIERAYHPELVDLCEDIIATQKMEIALMEMWLCDWYGICE